jgi:8-amino-7-oxononanoate synthase
MSRMDLIFTQELASADARQSRRRLRTAMPAAAGYVEFGDQTLLNFSSNDYLSLAQHPALIERSCLWTSQYGAGSQASRLVCGNLALHEAVEAKVAAMKGTEAALLFASGWQANAAVLPALIHAASRQGEAQVYTDRLNHASLHQGCRAAGARQIRFRHNDLNHLEALLSAPNEHGGLRFIITESVFSMDGDRADVVALAALAERFNAFLYLDEAHATGVLGPQGMGLAGLAPDGVDLIMGTFSKALGGFGAYVAGSREMCDYLLNTCSGFIHTTALPPGVLGAMDAALDLIPTLHAERERLIANGARARDGLQRLGLNTGNSSTQIIPAIIGDAGQTLTLSQALQARGILALAIRPPTVPGGTSRLRIALNAAHTHTDIDRLIDALADALASLPRGHSSS